MVGLKGEITFWRILSVFVGDIQTNPVTSSKRSLKANNREIAPLRITTSYTTLHTTNTFRCRHTS